MKIMIDTNVILDILQRREPYFTDSYKALHKALDEEYECLVSASAVTDIFYILKSLHSTEVARRCIEELSKVLSFADVISGDINTALMSNIDDFENAVVDAVAARNKSSFILTRNVRDFAGSVVKAVSPEAFSA